MVHIDIPRIDVTYSVLAIQTKKYTYETLYQGLYTIILEVTYFDYFVYFPFNNLTKCSINFLWAVATNSTNIYPLSGNRSLYSPLEQVHGPVPTQSVPQTATTTSQLPKPRTARLSPHLSGKTILQLCLITKLSKFTFWLQINRVYGS